ncbi:hypothetical protein ColLi_02194 [Colletotrichum liriopes]|uniref:Uncharacterized protein n=1 Tax=Colletotrichum liriopes TaxID=708192 RepID=A0AA37GFA2_9PEZI|nr:hypothetical protein ColLi_02194 [Colletotrichum liriopes]
MAQNPESGICRLTCVGVSGPDSVLLARDNECFPAKAWRVSAVREMMTGLSRDAAWCSSPEAPLDQGCLV